MIFDGDILGSSAVIEAEALSVSERKSCMFLLKLVLSLASKITEN